MKDLCVDFLQRITADIIIPVSRGGSKVPVTDFMLAEQVQNLPGPDLLDKFRLFEFFPEICFRGPDQLPDFFG